MLKFNEKFKRLNTWSAMHYTVNAGFRGMKIIGSDVIKLFYLTQISGTW